MAEMNVVPLVDVSLVLLIIFMVTAAFVKESGLNLKLPTSVTREVPTEAPQDITVAVLEGGKVYLDGAPIDKKVLTPTLAARAKKSPGSRVIVKGDRGTSYGQMVGVLDGVKQSGFAKISLATAPMTPQEGAH
jgi:biopolymer transport protein ExbD